MRRRNVLQKDDEPVAPLQQRTAKLLRSIDLFPKPEEEVAIKTRTGGYLSVLTSIVVLVLFMMEIKNYLAVDLLDRIVVDSEMSRPKIPIHMNITWHRLSCADVELVAMDVAGEHQIDIKGEIHKHRLTSLGELLGDKQSSIVDGKNKIPLVEANATSSSSSSNLDKCGSCYGAETEANQCCNTCKDVKDAYDLRGWDSSAISKSAVQCLSELGSPEIPLQDNEGCMVEGTLHVAKVNGNFHVGLGTSKSGPDGRIYHQFIPAQMGHYDSSHTINSLSFGPSFPGQLNPLSGTSKQVDSTESETASFQYFLQIVPVQFQEEWKERGYQYTYTQKRINIGEGHKSSNEKPKPHEGEAHKHPSVIAVLPGTFFIYEMNPFVVQKIQRSMTLAEFSMNLFGIIGGVVAISRFLDSFLSKMFGK